MILVTLRKLFVPVALVWLTAQLFLALPLADKQSSDKGLIYCPLQKKWVKPNPPPAAPAVFPLDEICAASNRKTEFSEQLLSRIPTVFRQHSRTDIVDLYFAYSKDGKDAFSKFGSLPNSPELPGSVFVARDSVASSTQRNILPITTTASIGFDAYKETLVAAETPYFEREEVRLLRFLSRSLRPRAPPLS
jgi:hypothetical protein